MARDVAYKPSKDGKKWVKSGFTGGLCFTLTYDKLELLLKEAGRLKDNERIERVEIGAEGITIFIEKEVE